MSIIHVASFSVKKKKKHLTLLFPGLHFDYSAVKYTCLCFLFVCVCLSVKRVAMYNHFVLLSFFFMLFLLVWFTFQIILAL